MVMDIKKAASSRPARGGHGKHTVPSITTKEELKELIWKYHGIVTLVCTHLDISYCQFYKAVRTWELMDDLKKAKEMFLDKAQAVIFDSLDSKSETTRLRAAETVIRHSAPQPAQEVTIKEGDDGQKEIQIRQIFGISDE